MTNGKKTKVVYVVTDSQGQIIGVFAKRKDAEQAESNHCYFCKISEQEIK